jgi:plasmid stabilization system protein ParE
MAEIVWTEPAIADLEAIADYIAIESRRAASGLVQRILAHVEHLATHPESGSRPQEFVRSTPYRQIVEPPSRIFYRLDGERALIFHVMRLSESFAHPAGHAADVQASRTRRCSRRGHFGDADTEALAGGRRVGRFVRIEAVARRKLRQLEIAG